MLAVYRTNDSVLDRFTDTLSTIVLLSKLTYYSERLTLTLLILTIKHNDT